MIATRADPHAIETGSDIILDENADTHLLIHHVEENTIKMIISSGMENNKECLECRAQLLEALEKRLDLAAETPNEWIEIQRKFSRKLENLTFKPYKDTIQQEFWWYEMDEEDYSWKITQKPM